MPRAWMSLSWCCIIWFSRPRRRYDGCTVTNVTAATGTDPPGTVITRLYAPQVEIQRPSTVKPKLRAGSKTRRPGSQCAAWYSSWNPRMVAAKKSSVDASVAYRRARSARCGGVGPFGMGTVIPQRRLSPSAGSLHL